MQTDPNKSEAVVHSFIEALNNEDFEKAGSFLNGNMKFDGVMGKRDGAEAYIGDMSKMKFKYEVRRSFADGNDVCLLYDIDMGDATIFTCGWYQLENDKIKTIKVVFDPRPLLDE